MEVKTAPNGNAKWSPGDMPQEVLGPLVRRLLLRPWRVVAIDDWRRWRGIHLYAGAVALAKAIEQQTERPRVGVMLPTSGLFPMAVIATWLLHRTAVPVNYLLRSAEREYVIADAGLDLVITVRPMLEQFGELPPNVKPLLLDEMKFPRVPRFRRRPKIRPEETAVVMYTSGTSGKPKGVELTHANLAANAWQCAIWGEVTSRDIFLGVLPQFHSFGLTVLTLLPLTTGARAVYTARFVPRRLVELLRKHRPTGFVGIPAMYNGLLADRTAGPADLASLRLLICGGEPLAETVRKRVEERFHITINEGYGLTETGPVLNWARPGEVEQGCVGKAVPLVEERIFDKGGAETPVGVDGEICVRGPNVMKGYLNRPESTAAVMDAQGFFHTGDIGHVDDAGRLFITGRLSDLIIVAGENVFPREIEDVLSHHVSVKEAAVIGMKDSVRGEVPVAYIELAEGATLDEQRLRAFCREQLAGFKVPRRIFAVEELPRTPTGKVMKRALVEMVAGGEKAPVPAEGN